MNSVEAKTPSSRRHRDAGTDTPLRSSVSTEPEETAKKKRNSVDIHPDVADLLDQLARDMNLRTRAEVLRKAVQLLALVNKHRSEGDMVVYLPRDKKGQLSPIHIL